eukprot:g13430.t1
MEPSEACADFATASYYRGSSWTFDDCVEVWEHFRRSVPRWLQRRLPDVDLWGHKGVELRQAGSPCLVASTPTLDGVGSSTIRHLATWIYSKQMGCDWVTPDWGKRNVGHGNGSEVMYCHSMATTSERASKPLEELKVVQRCSVVDWQSYFQFDVPSIDMPEGVTLQYVEVRYDESPECAFDHNRLNFAVHVRMGDRRKFFQDGNTQYFELLELIMSTISEEVVDRGLPLPLFHVFSETLAPCPSGETGLFDEFPHWPVGVDKLPECMAAPAPTDCPEKRAGGLCSPERNGIFKVVGKNIVLHVGPDVQNALSCMIHADGVLMGCSTFGQVAGLLTKGISMFSMACGGPGTPEQYKSIPPLAVAEKGHLWVPIAGSWRDPVMMSPTLFRAALDSLLAEKSPVE